MDAGEQTPTASNDCSLNWELQQQEQLDAAAKPPAFLSRLMEDYARQLKRRAPMREEQTDNRSRSSTMGQQLGDSSGKADSSTFTSDTNGLQVVSEHSPRPFAVTSPIINGSFPPSLRPPPPSALPSFSLPRPSLPAADSSATIVAAKAPSLGSTTPLTNFTTPNLRRLEDVYSPPKEIAPEEELLPPENFAMVSTFVYRSSFPKRKNFPFLRSLGLKSVL